MPFQCGKMHSYGLMNSEHTYIYVLIPTSYEYTYAIPTAYGKKIKG